MSLREYHRPTDRESAAYLLSRTHTTTRPIFLGPRPVALDEQTWEAAVDLSRLGLAFIKRVADGGFRIGALTPLQDIVTSPDLQQYAGGLLSRGARFAGHLGMRNVSNLGGVLTTVGGAPELRLALLVLDYQPVSAEGFITELRLPAQTLVTSLERVARTPLDEAIVAVAVGLQPRDSVIAQARLAVSGISKYPIRVEAAEAILTAQKPTPNLIDKVAAAVVSAADPDYSDYRGSAEYRREIAAVLTRRAVETAWQQEDKE